MTYEVTCENCKGIIYDAEYNMTSVWVNEDTENEDILIVCYPCRDDIEKA